VIGSFHIQVVELRTEIIENVPHLLMETNPNRVTIGPLDTADPHFELLKCAEEGRVDRLHSLLASRHLPRKEVVINKDDEEEEEEPLILDIECCYRVSGLTPLAAAALEDQVESVKVLLSYGADPNTRDNEGMSPLLTATDLGIAEALLKHGAKVDTRDPETGSTAFLLAFLRADVPLWRLLVRFKANVNVADRSGQHALNTAIDSGDFESASFLLDHGANSRLCDSEGTPPLVTACRMARLDLVRLLLANGADVERSEPSQADTPLIVAARGNNLEMVRELCNHGCKVLKHNKHGDTAIHCARTLGFDDVALVLESFARLRREMMPAGLQPILGPGGSPRFKQEPPLPPSRQKAPGMKLAKAVARNHAAIEQLGAKMKKIMDEEREQREKEEAAIAAAAEAKRLAIEMEKQERIERFRKEKAMQEEEEERLAQIQRDEEKARNLANAHDDDNLYESKDALHAIMMTALYTSRGKGGEGATMTSSFESIHDAKRYLEELRGKALLTDDQLRPLPTPAIREWFMPDLLGTGPRFVALDASTTSVLPSSASFSTSSPPSVFNDGFSLPSRANSPSRNARLIVEPRDYPAAANVRRFIEGSSNTQTGGLSHNGTKKLRSLREMEHANLKRSKKIAEKKLADALKERLEHVSPRFASSSSSFLDIGSDEHLKRVFDLGASLVLKGQHSTATLSDLNIRPGLSFLSVEKKHEKEVSIGGGSGSSLAATLQLARNQYQHQNLQLSQHSLLTSPMRSSKTKH